MAFYASSEGPSVYENTHVVVPKQSGKVLRLCLGILLLFMVVVAYARFAQGEILNIMAPTREIARRPQKTEIYFATRSYRLRRDECLSDG
ncbi:hypothetical protein NEOLI_001578 [Neolecta irregularis DAH-3]|uniref:Uncharacterized protein n=1 Tax=Neolecta irregularis (strain DAH-3) TaxID=1198029 RepID=A0A1U7LIA9_NEOID|nr:hypothetical protein NEOLI_001578 [Neolecta irregularis DAH-3]|eukprot:OLL22379.1 hypothetical protein NEOLI_001578 [Neolecta irregularis DAH-3]